MRTSLTLSCCFVGYTITQLLEKYKRAVVKAVMRLKNYLTFTPFRPPVFSQRVLNLKPLPPSPVAAPPEERHRGSPLILHLRLHLLFLPPAVPVMPPSCCGCLSQYTHHHLVAFLLTFFR